MHCALIKKVERRELTPLVSRVANEFGIYVERVEGYERQEAELQELLKKMAPVEEIQKAQGDARANWGSRIGHR